MNSLVHFYPFILLGIFFLVATLGLLSVDKKPPFGILVLVGCCLIIIAGLRSEGMDRDYTNYLILFDNYDELLPELTEPTFIYLSGFVKNFFSSSSALFVVYALLGVSIKLYAIRRLTEFWFFSALLYFSTFFLLHEMTQIRAGVASGIFLLSLIPLRERKFLPFFLLILLATSFHYSSVVALPLYFLSSKNLNRAGWVGLIIGVYLLHFGDIHFSSLINFLPLENVQFKLEANKEVMQINEDKIQVFNVLQMLRLLFCLFLLWKADVMQQGNSYSILLLKIYILSLCSMVMFADIATFAVRISEFFGVVEFVLLPSLVYAIPSRRTAALFLSFVALVFITTNLFYTKLFVF